jgi:hypothetical protein
MVSGALAYDNFPNFEGTPAIRSSAWPLLIRFPPRCTASVQHGGTAYFINEQVINAFAQLPAPRT